MPVDWPNQHKFRGRIIHSHSYKDHVGYEDARIVVVGVGNSGGDIAVELSRIAQQVSMFT
jgi:dimethylaniline monooxygenase (N-oxide forming)